MKWSRDTAYLMGIMATDGCIQKRENQTSVSSIDKCLISWVKGHAGFTSSVRTYKRVDGIIHCITGSNRSFRDFCIKIGIKTRKTYTIGSLEIPRRYWRSFLLGVCDGDGSIFRWIKTVRYKTKIYRYPQLRVHIGTASKNFAQFVLRLIKSLNIHAFMQVRPPAKSGWSVFYEVISDNENARKLLDEMYSRVGSFSLPRKKKIYASVVKDKFFEVKKDSAC